MKKHQTVIVVDFGGQYTQLIVRRVREMGVYSEMVPWTTAEAKIRETQPDAVILSGGPRSVLEDCAPTLDMAVLKDIPTLGICYGQQLMAFQLGGKIQQGTNREYGKRRIRVSENSGSLKSDLKTQGSTLTTSGTHLKAQGSRLKAPSPALNTQYSTLNTSSLVAGLSSDQVWMSHGDDVLEVPPGFTVTASTDTCPIAGMENDADRQYAVQFHPEVTHTPGGKTILHRFLFEKAKLKGDWTSESFIEDQVTAIRAQVGEGKVLCAVSGGVDSAVMAALLIKAIGEKAMCVFVDHGLLRKNEAEQVKETFISHFHANLKVFDAKDQFFAELKGQTDPERKRKIVGEQFVKVFEQHADELKDCDFLAQGTLYPDVIESGSPTAAKIKTHHNVGGLPDWMRMKLIEPLRWLFKDEVRAVGRKLGLPEDMVEREPFPGPGLSVRILGEVTPERVHMVQEADWIFREELKARGQNKGIWQSYAALLDVKSVGVMGDERTYQQPIVLRAVASEDAMTAHAVNIPFETLEHVANRIVNEVHGVNRVFYDLTSKPPATIELE